MGVRYCRHRDGENKERRQKSGGCQGMYHLPVLKQSWRGNAARYLVPVKIAELQLKAELVAHDRSDKSAEESLRKAASEHLFVEPG